MDVLGSALQQRKDKKADTQSIIHEIKTRRSSLNVAAAKASASELSDGSSGSPVVSRPSSPVTATTGREGRAIVFGSSIYTDTPNKPVVRLLFDR